MATTTVRLDPEDENTLDQLAAIHGGRSQVLRLGLQLVAADTQRRAALDELLAEWDLERGPVSQADIDAITQRYHLDS